MDTYTFKITKHTIPNCQPLHIANPRGYAYRSGNHNVCLLGSDSGLYIIQTGLTVIQESEKDIVNWIDEVFGGTSINHLGNINGKLKKYIWRPGIYHDSDFEKYLEVDLNDRRVADRHLLNTINKFNEIINFISPHQETMNAFSIKNRELIIMACTDCEDHFRKFLRRFSYNLDGRISTNDYVKIKDPLRIQEYEISMPEFGPALNFQPFAGWDASNPTKSLYWYDAYNAVKHDRSENIILATIKNCINAVYANIILYIAHFGPYRLHNGNDALAAQFNSLFQINIVSPDYNSFYIPKIVLGSNTRSDLCVVDSRINNIIGRWAIEDVVL